MEVAPQQQQPPAGAAPQQRQPQEATPAVQLPWFKLAAVLALLLACLALRAAEFALEAKIAERKHRHKIQQRQRNRNQQQRNPESSQSSSQSSSSRQQQQQQQFVQNAAPNEYGELLSHHETSQQPYSTTTTTAQQPAADAQHYWNQVLAWGLLNWAGEEEQPSSTSNNEKNQFPEPDAPDASQKTVHALRALQRAADLGHPEAQFYLASSLAAGFWTVSARQPDAPLSLHSNNNNNNNNWTVADAWLWQDDGHGNSNIQQQQQQQQQQATSWLLYRMAAQAGHVEAALALAYRLELAHAQSSPLGSGKTDANGKDGSSAQQRHCAARLPYYAAAAHAAVDQLLLDPHSRGWVPPPRDRHVLHQVHLHGGAGSRLDPDNRPSESSETLQFYHVRAVTLLHHDPADPDIDDAVTAAAAAAFTLARYHHLGLRGVHQNCTAAAYYYELAATAGHWEAAGQAGALHLWGAGVPQNAPAAHRLFRQGLGGGPGNRHRNADAAQLLQACQQRHQQRVQQQQQQKNVGSGDKVYLCDDASLNGMGLLHLWGVPMVVPVDRKTALDYLELARDQGNADAAYHLAMTKLGWKTHYRTLDKLQENGTTQDPKQLFPLHGNTADRDKPLGHLLPSEYQRVLTDLTTAASKNHILARHRLALLYEDGVTVPKVGGSSKNAVVQVVPRDCPKALQHYKWVAHHGHRAGAERLRRAYRQYMAGEASASLRNYLVAAETGDELAQANAAFLMERGTCLGLDAHHHRRAGRDCAAAAVRLWKAAAQKQHSSAEASLRVGDFYYYGRFRSDGPNGSTGSSKEMGLPFGWLPHVLYPEQYLFPAVWEIVKRGILRPKQQQQQKNEPSASCHAPDSSGGSEPGTCLASDAANDKSDNDDQQHSLEQDLAMAVHYYRQAADQGSNPRGHFNLGFMYQWGLGVKQDFPLAKREYDLALSNTGVAQEADLPVTLALWALSAHEWGVKLYRSWQDYWQRSHASSSGDTIRSDDDGSATPSPADSIGSAHHGSSTNESPRRREGSQAGRPVPGSTSAQHSQTKVDVILSHLFSWESLLILVLTVVLSRLFKIRRTRGR